MRFKADDIIISKLEYISYGKRFIKILGHKTNRFGETEYVFKFLNNHRNAESKVRIDILEDSYDLHVIYYNSIWTNLCI